MRYFLGIDIPAQTKFAMQDWRDKAWSQHRELGSVPAANFHITLAFLGHINEQQLDVLTSQISTIDQSHFELCINQFNVWQKPPIAWLGCSSVTEQLAELQAAVVRCARIAKIQMIEREYIPHVTVARKCKGLVTAPLLEPNFCFDVDHFCLFESVSTSSGVCYPVREHWPLSPT